MSRGGTLRARRTLLLVSLLFYAAPSAAQDQEAAAERLFREGQKLLEERKYAEACPKFEASYEKDGTLGTLLNLAFCHKEQGAVGLAWIEFREAEIKASEQNRADRRDFARRQLAEIEKSLGKLVVDNPESVPLTEVQIDEHKVPEAETGAAFAAEPGQRKLTFRVSGKKPATIVVTVAKGDKPQHVALPEMADESEGVVGALEPEGGERTVDLGLDGPSSGPSQRTLAFGALGLGAVAFLVDSVSGVMTLTNDCATAFGDRSACTQEAADSGETTALVSTISFALAAGAGVAGAILWFTAPKVDPSPKSAKPPPAAWLRPAVGPGYAGVHGRF